MMQPPVRPRRILAVMDESDGQTALLTAAALAKRYDAELAVFGCVEPPPDLGVIARLSEQDPDQLLQRLCAEKTERMVERLARHLPDQQIAPQIRVGKAFIEIIKHVLDAGCDFVVKRAEPLSGIHRLLFASTDQHLLRKCPCPVWMQPDGAARLAKRVIAAVDVDLADAAEPETLMSLNRRVIETACLVAAPTGAQVTVLHGWDTAGEGLVWAFSSDRGARITADGYVNEILKERQVAMRRLIDTVGADQSGRDYPMLTPHLIRGAPETVIAQQSQALGADVVVMGTVARTGLSGVFIGNTAENIINTLECPVLAVKPEGFVSPLDPDFGKATVSSPSSP
ncbi:universal stress protein [Yoonia sp. GPGPB17]|uniref:universal stress protein n=1 Tax=Yoonia sp. GPGPB17 TaxID=3026147 RepID=UPI0030C5F1BE